MVKAGSSGGSGGRRCSGGSGGRRCSGGSGGRRWRCKGSNGGGRRCSGGSGGGRWKGKGSGGWREVRQGNIKCSKCPSYKVQVTWSLGAQSFSCS